MLPKTKFLVDLDKRKAAKIPKTAVAQVPTQAVTPPLPQTMQIEVNGELFEVKINYDQPGAKPSLAGTTPLPNTHQRPASGAKPKPKAAKNAQAIVAPLEGKFFLTKDHQEKAIQVGDRIEKGDVVGYIESMKVINAVTADQAGVVVEIVAQHGEDIEEDDPIVKLNP